MTKTLISAISIACLALFSVSCKKEKKEETPTPVVNTPNPIESMFGTVALPGAHDGALYSIIQFSENSFDGSWEQYGVKSGFAWFGNSTKTEDAGDLSFNDNELFSVSDPSSPFNWYFGSSDYSAASDLWVATGGPKHPAFSTTDNTAYPEVTNLVTTPSILTETSGLTVTYTAASGSTGTIITVLNGYGERISTSEMGSGTKTIKFSAAQIKELVDDSPSIIVQVMPVKMTLKNVAAKKYYFVKQAAYNREIEAR
ncbi:MAG: hypothetical protein V4616_02295 [Bacteroidota bacterium]